jgi:PAS domain S-box-containing protein
VHGIPPWRQAFRFAVIILLEAIYFGLAWHFHVVLHAGTVYVHFGYVPIVLAAMWWGWRGIVVAGFQAGLLVTLRLIGIGIGDPWSDAVRVVFLLLVGLCVAFLRESLGRARRRVAQTWSSYRSLFDKSPDGVFVYEGETVVLSSSRLCEMLGSIADDLVGRSIEELFLPEDWSKVQAQLRRRAAGEALDLHYEARLLRADGTPLWVDVISSPFLFDGRSAVLVNVHDITRRREEERQRRELSELAQQQEEQLVHSTRLAELGEMAAAVAHELNQPLSGIRTYAKNAIYMLENEAGEPGEVRENLERISEQVDRAARIIGQMRQLARRSERQFAAVDVNAIATEAVDFLRSQMDLSGVAVELDLAPGLPPIQGDRIRLEQVLLNLLNNARQAMEESPRRRLRVATEPRQEGGRPFLAVVVADTGKGFANDTVPKLFTPFFTTKKPGQGTGLGLAISLNIVKDHEGRIDAVGVPGGGATFTVLLPVDAPASPAAGATAPAGEAG